MAELHDFSPEQLQEAKQWYQEHNPLLVEMVNGNEAMTIQLADVYFKLKMISIELRPNQFVVGVDYNGVTKQDYLANKADLTKLVINLNFWNPHPVGVADQLAKDILVSKLTTL